MKEEIDTESGIDAFGAYLEARGFWAMFADWLFRGYRWDSHAFSWIKKRNRARWKARNQFIRQIDASRCRYPSRKEWDEFERRQAL